VLDEVREWQNWPLDPVYPVIFFDGSSCMMAAWAADRSSSLPAKLHLGQWDRLDAAIRDIDREVDSRIEQMDQKLEEGEPPFRAALIVRLSAIPGVSTLSATTIRSEIGRDIGFRLPVIWSPGPGCALARTRVPARGVSESLCKRSRIFRFEPSAR
jgi:hypothetical protein